jgi:hypothetical protein
MDLGGPQAVKVLSPEILFLRECAEVLFITEGNTLRRWSWRVVQGHPGSEAGSRSTICHDGNQGDPRFSSAREYAGTSRRGEEGRRGCGSRIAE